MKKIAYILFVLIGLFFISCYNDSKDLPSKINYPEIVLRLNQTQLVSGSTYAASTLISDTAVSSSTTVNVIIENIGKEYLNLTGSPIVDIGGADASMFIVTTQPSDFLAPFSYKTFQVVFTPTSSGTKTCTINVHSNDPNTGFFSVTMNANGTLPVPVQEIYVEDPASAIIASGGTVNLTPTCNVGSTQNYTFTIYNSTAATSLTVSIPIISGIDQSQFAVVTPPVSPVSGVGSTTFVISFTPVSAGLKYATILLTNNDSDENPYIINIVGTGVAVPQPDIEVRQGVTLYKTTSDPYEFGKINQGSSSAFVTFSVKNKGTDDLNLTSVSMTNPGEFTLNNTTSTPVGFPNGSTDFTVVFHPTSAGLKSAVVTIVSDDIDTPSYSFNVQGTGDSIPEIYIEDDTSALILSGGLYSGFNTVAGTPQGKTFTIYNTFGLANLLLSSNPIIAITPSGGKFSVTLNPLAIVGAGLSDTFEITYSPLETGTDTAIVSIANNDLTDNENPYIFTISGTATANLQPKIDVRQSGTSITEGETVDLGGMGVTAGTPLTASFTIHNMGTDDLLIPAPNITVTGDPDFSMPAWGAATILPGGNVTFTVSFTATLPGTRNATVNIISNDTTHSPFTIYLTGTGMEPDINVTGALAFGNVNFGAFKDTTFNIVNTAGAGVENTLYLTGSPDKVEFVSSTGPGSFTVLSQPVLAYVNPSGGTASFAIRFQPAGTGASTATFRIYSNDFDENPYSFTVTGTGTSPEIQVTQADHLPTINVNSGVTYTEFSNFNYNVSAAQTKTFIIHNTGTGNLLLTGAGPAFVTITGADPTSFSITSNPTPIIGAGGTTSFDIRFNPVLPLGTKTAIVTIYNNDLDESTYAFNIQGICEDITNPTVNITSPGALEVVNALKNITFTFSDNVGVIGVQGQGNGAGYGVDLVSGISTIGTISGWAAAAEDSTITLQLRARDSVPNYGYASVNVIKDTVSPTVSISAPSVSYAKNGTSVTYTITYTDLHFDNSSALDPLVNIVLNQTLTANGTVTVDGAIGSTRVVTISGVTGNGTLGITIGAGSGVDLAGNLALSSAASGTFTVDNTPPTISSITTTKLDGFYKIGEVIPVTITFSENVTLGGVGNIEIALNSGGIVTIGSLTTPTTADGTYTVGAGQNSLDLTASGVSLTGTASLRDAALNDTNVALPPFGFNIGDVKNIVIDTTVPTVTGVTLPGAGTYKLGATIDFVVNFSENITVVGASDTLTLTLDSGAVTASQFAVGANSITYRYTVGAGALDSGVIAVGAITLNGTTIQDASGNYADPTIGAVSTVGVIVDGVVPTVTGVTLPGGGTGSYFTTTTITFDIIFGEALTSYGTDSTLSLTFDSGNVSAIYSSYLAGTITYSYTISGVIPDYDALGGITVNGIVLGAVPIQDAAGNDAVLTLTSTVNTIKINN